jgi:hypothetical protein
MTVLGFILRILPWNLVIFVLVIVYLGRRIWNEFYSAYQDFMHQINCIIDFAQDVLNGAEYVLKFLTNTFGTALATTENALGKVIVGAAGAAGDVASGTEGAAGDVASGVKGVGENVASGAVDIAGSAAGAAVDIAGSSEGAAVASGAEDAYNQVTDNLPSVPGIGSF